MATATLTSCAAVYHEPSGGDDESAAAADIVRADIVRVDIDEDGSEQRTPVLFGDKRDALNSLTVSEGFILSLATRPAFQACLQHVVTPFKYAGRTVYETVDDENAAVARMQALTQQCPLFGIVEKMRRDEIVAAKPRVAAYLRALVPHYYDNEDTYWFFEQMPQCCDYKRLLAKYVTSQAKMFFDAVVTTPPS